MNKFSLAVAAVAAGMLAFAGTAQADCSIDLGGGLGTLNFDNPGKFNELIQTHPQIQSLAGQLGVSIGNANELHRALAGATGLPSTGTPIGDPAFKTGQVMQFVQSACGQGSGDPS